MFTGIVETIGKVINLQQEGTNLHLTIQSSLSAELKIDQSVAHNGVCLTVVKQEKDTHTVTAIQETLLKTNLGKLQVGDKVNLERAMKLGARVDGHLVQGHVDLTATITDIEVLAGSWQFTIQVNQQTDNVLIPKGSICIDGTSLTVMETTPDWFKVAIIPYTFEHTLFHAYKINSIVNIEYDMMGKYITALFQKQKQTSLY